jgi:uncharacterized membrane protein YfcA
LELTALTIILLSLILVASHTAETVLGFGATLIALALGSLVVPLERLLAVLVMLGLVQSFWLIFRGIPHIQWKLLLVLVLPAAGLGTIAGAFFRDIADEQLLRLILGGFVVVVAVSELVLLTRQPHRVRSISHAVAAPLLFAGGIFHGLFASGGPLVVYVTSRKITDPRAFRATLAVLWTALNLGLITQMGLAGHVTANVLTMTAILLPAALLGIAIGERMRVNERTFQALTYGLLCFAGLTLLVP